MKRIVKYYLIFILILSFVLTISSKIADVYIYKSNDLNDYFESYLYREYFSWLFICVFILTLVYFSMSSKLIDSKKQLMRYLLNLVRFIVLVFLTIMPVGITTQIIADINLYNKKELIDTQLSISSYRLSDGIKTSNTQLPYIIKDTSETYYLYKKHDLTKKDYSIIYFKNSRGDNIILAISE